MYLLAVVSLPLRQRMEAIKKHCKTNPRKLMRPTLLHAAHSPAHSLSRPCMHRSVAGRKDVYENLWMYYVELAVKGSYKPLGSMRLHCVQKKNCCFLKT